MSDYDELNLSAEYVLRPVLIKKLQQHDTTNAAKYARMNKAQLVRAWKNTGKILRVRPDQAWRDGLREDLIKKFPHKRELIEKMLKQDLQNIFRDLNMQVVPYQAPGPLASLSPNGGRNGSGDGHSQKIVEIEGQDFKQNLLADLEQYLTADGAPGIGQQNAGRRDVVQAQDQSLLLWILVTIVLIIAAVVITALCMIILLRDNDDGY